MNIVVVINGNSRPNAVSIPPGDPFIRCPASSPIIALLIINLPPVRLIFPDDVQITPGIGPYGDPEWSFSVDGQYGGKVSAVIAFTDEQGRRGTVTAVAPLPR